MYTKEEKNDLMGKIIEVSNEFKRIKTYVDHDTTMVEQVNTDIAPKRAWITGFGNIKEGNIVTVREDPEYNKFDTINTIPCIKVKYSYKEREYNIPLDGFKVVITKPEYPEANADKMARRKANVLANILSEEFFKEVLSSVKKHVL